MRHSAYKSKVGAAIVERREKLYHSRRAAARAARISETAWRHIESGEKNGAPYHASNLQRSAVCRALDWPDNALDLLEAGRSTAFLESVDPGHVETRDLTAEEVALVQRYIRGLRATRDEVARPRQN